MCNVLKIQQLNKHIDYSFSLFIFRTAESSWPINKQTCCPGPACGTGRSGCRAPTPPFPGIWGKCRDKAQMKSESNIIHLELEM